MTSDMTEAFLTNMVIVERPRPDKRKSKASAIVTKSNDLTRGEISKIDSVLFGRLINIFISQISRDDEDFRDYTLPLIALMPEGKRSGTYYAAIDKYAKEWLKSTVAIRIDADRVALYPLFSKLEINRKTNHITVNIHKDLKPHLLDLKKHFTQFPLHEYLRLSTVKTQRLFELLCSWHDKIQVEISLSALHTFLDTEEYLRKNSSTFRTRVLEPAHKEILKNTSLYYEWSIEKKTARKATTVIFSFALPALKQPSFVEEGETGEK